MNVQVTQPEFIVNTAASRNTTSPAATITVTAADASGTAHYTTENVIVTLTSSAQSVAAIDSATVTIPSGTSSVGSAKWSPGVVGTATLSAADPRTTAYYAYTTGSQAVTVVTPSIAFSWGSQTLGIGQYIDEYVSTPDNAALPIDVAFAHVGLARTETDTGSVPTTSVRISQGTSYTYFRTIGLSAGTDTLVGNTTSPAHTPDTAYTVVGQGLIDPVVGWPATLKAGDSVQVTLYARDPAGNQRFVLAATAFTLAPNSFIEFHSGGVVITQVPIPADQYYVQFYVKGLSAGAGSASITATNYQPYSNTVTVTP